MTTVVPALTALALALLPDPFYQAITIDHSSDAAAWLLPRDEKADAFESKAKLAFMQQLLSPAGFHNYQSILSFMSALAARHVSEDAWYLSIIGVHPSAQGKGIGQELLTPTLSEHAA